MREYIQTKVITPRTMGTKSVALTEVKCVQHIMFSSWQPVINCQTIGLANITCNQFSGKYMEEGTKRNCVQAKGVTCILMETGIFKTNFYCV